MAEKEIKVLFPEEKMEALNYFMKQKELEVEKMLTEHLEKIYEKIVPAPVREFTESKLYVENEEALEVENGANNQRRTRERTAERAERRNARAVNQNQNAQPQVEATEETQDEGQEENSGMVMEM